MGLRIWRAAFGVAVAMLALGAAGAVGPVQQPTPLTAVLCDGPAMGLLKPKLTDARSWQSGDLTTISGRISGRRVLLVEFGNAAQKVEEETRAILEDFRPAEVIIVGAAGALNPKVQPGDVVIARTAIYHTYGFAGAEARQPRELMRPLEFAAAPWLVRAASQRVATVALEQYSQSGRKPTTSVGPIATVGLFVKSTEVRDRIRAEAGADAVAMEGAIIAEVCAQRGIPWVEIRSISDYADEAAGETYRQNRGLAAQIGTAVVLDLLRRLDALPRALTDEEAKRYLPDIALAPAIETASDDGRLLLGLMLKNAGKVWCPGFQVQVTLIEGEEATGNAVVKRYSIEPLRPDKERRLLIQIPASQEGFRTVTALADPDDEIAEFDEENNRASRDL